MALCPLCQCETDDVKKHLKTRRTYGGHGLGPIEIERHMKDMPKPPPEPLGAIGPSDPGTDGQGGWGFFLTHP